MADPNDLTIEVKIDDSTTIKGDTKDVDTKNGNFIQRFQLDSKVGMPDYFSLQVQMTDGMDIALLDSIKPGAKVDIKVGYGVEATIIKNGEISMIEPSFAAGVNHLTMSGFSASHRLTRGTTSQHFGDGHEVNQNFGQLASTLVGDSKSGKGEKSDGLAVTADNTQSKTSYVAFYNTSLYDAIRQIGGSFGLDWNTGADSDGKKLTLKALEPGSKALTIYREKGNPPDEKQALTADFLCSTTRQVSKVIVRGWDFAAKKPIKGEADSVTPIIGGTAGYEQAGMAHHESSSSGRVIEIVDQPVSSVGEAEEIAKSLMSKYSMDWQSAQVAIEGVPTLRAGMLVHLIGFGVRYSGDYLVNGANHIFIAGSGQAYKTYLSLVRNGSPEP